MYPIKTEHRSYIIYAIYIMLINIMVERSIYISCIIL